MVNTIADFGIYGFCDFFVNLKIPKSEITKYAPGIILSIYILKLPLPFLSFCS